MFKALRRSLARRWAFGLAAVILAGMGCGGGTVLSPGGGGNGNGNGGNGNGVGGTTLTGLLYEATSSPRSGIYTVKTDATGETRVVDYSTTPLGPRFCFDGQKVAFSGGSGVTVLYTVNTDGTGLAQAPNSTLYTNASAPSFSPDGKKLVFVGDTSLSADRNVFTITLAGGVVQRLTTLPSGFSADRPIFSPDGTKILFARVRTNDVAAASDLWKMNADGSNLAALTTTSKEMEPNYSQDGKKIVFVSWRDGNNEIYVMNADGTGQTRLTNNAGDDNAPVFSPDGTYIAFLSDREQSGTFKIYSMKSDGTNVNKFNDARIDRDFLDWR